MGKKDLKFKYPGIPVAMDGNTAAIMCERESSDAAGAYPITPSTQMGEYWADAAAKGHLNISDRPLIFIEPEGEQSKITIEAHPQNPSLFSRIALFILKIFVSKSVKELITNIKMSAEKEELIMQ